MRKNYPYFYGIYDNPDDELFYKQCAAIEKYISGLSKNNLLEDMDGTLIQIYHHNNGEIRVCNDYFLGDLYVEAEFDLLPYFQDTIQQAENHFEESDELERIAV